MSNFPDNLQWTFFICGLLAWTADAFDFHALSIQTVKFAAYYKTTNTNVTTALTLTLLLRSVGAAFFGLAGDRFGRKWPMVINMFVVGLLQIATIYSRTFHQFLAVRSLFGLFMGGVYGNAIAMALEHCPVNARGLMSGILQQGYSLGYVLAASANLGVGGSTNSWKVSFADFWLFIDVYQCRKSSGSVPAYRLGLELFESSFPKADNFSRPRKMGKRKLPLVRSGGIPGRC